MGERTSSEWAWDQSTGTWLRTTNDTPHLLANGKHLGVENLIVQVTRYRLTTDVDAGGFAVPEADIVGDGEAYIFSAGMLVKGRWTKKSGGDVTQFVDGSGAPVKLTPGRTWVQFAPLDPKHPVAPR